MTEPIAIHRGPLRDFLEVPFAPGSEGPHSTMESIELQTLELPDGRTGAMVKIQHHGGVVDLYPSEHLGLGAAALHGDPAFAHLSIASVTPTTFAAAELDASDTHAACHVDFDDRHGQRIELHVHATRTTPAKPIFIPAPPQRHPRTLRLLYVDHFWLLRKRRSSITLRYGGDPLRPVGLPDHPAAPFWSARVGVGNHLSGINIDEVVPELVGPDHCFTFDLEGSQDEFVVSCPLGVVAEGRRCDSGPGPVISVVVDWAPSLRRPALWVLSHIRRLRRRNEQWVWKDGQWEN